MRVSKYLMLAGIIFLTLCDMVYGANLFEYQLNISNTFPNTGISSSAVFREAGEQVWFVWETIDPEDSDYEIYLRVLSDGKLSNQFNLSGNSTADRNPSITSYNNFVYMAYQSYNSSSEKFDIIVVGERDGHSVQDPFVPGIYPGTGADPGSDFPTLPLDEDFNVQIEPGVTVSSLFTNDTNPRIVADSSGILHIVWTGSISSGESSAIYYRRFNYDSQVLSPIYQVSELIGTINDKPQISLSESGEPLIAWHAHDGNDTEIYYRKIMAMGMGPILQITNNDLKDKNSSISKIFDGKVYVAWEQQNEEGTDLYAARINVSDSTLDIAPHGVATKPSPEESPYLLTLNSGQCQMVYVRKDGSVSKLLYQILDDTDSGIKTLQSAKTINYLNPTGVSTAGNDAVYFYEGKNIDVHYIFILGPEYLF